MPTHKSHAKGKNKGHPLLEKEVLLALATRQFKYGVFNVSAFR